MEPQREEKLEHLEKLLQSQTLHGSESLRAFLRFVVLRTLDNQDALLKEYTIATEVFGRDTRYDPRTDSVVRVQAGRLRSKLQEYYAGEGKTDRVLLDLPKGHYSPVFSYAENENGSVAAAPAETLTTPFARMAAPVPHRGMKFAVTGLAALSLLLGIVTAFYRSEANRLRADLSSRVDDIDLKALSPLWDGFLRPSEPVVVAYSNAVFQGRAETGMKYLTPLDSRGVGFGSPQTQSAADHNAPFITDHYTGVGEVMSVYFLGSLFWKAGRSFHVKRSLLLTWDDLKTQNVVVIGSAAENLLLRELPQEQDFVFRLVKDERQSPQFGIVNLKPQPGEEKAYFANEEGSSTSQLVEDYAVVSMLKGLDANHKLLNLAGIKTFGTQAAAEYVTKPEYVKELTARLNISRQPDVPTVPSYYQVLLRVKVNGGVPVQISYVTHHTLN